MRYEDWEQTIPARVKRDPVWKFYAYRKALYLYELAWDDCALLMVDPRGRVVATQAINAVASVSANIEEGLGRGYGKDRNRFLRISLGSARESKGWYLRGRRLLLPTLVEQRMALVDEIISLLVTELNRQR